MDTRPINSQTLSSSVIAVPPLARDANLAIERRQNERLVRYLEQGGVKTLLYGGNAVLGHVAFSEYAELLKMLTEIVADDTLVVPSVGPAYGLMMDQATILKDFGFPTAMLLPSLDPSTPAGLASSLRALTDRMNQPAVLYLKYEGKLDVSTVRKLVDDGLVSWIKYAIVRTDPAEDNFLRELGDVVDPRLIVSGIGEQPAICHLNEFGLVSFTSGCVCVAPQKSMQMLAALQKKDLTTAESIRGAFKPLEDLRDEISPVRVLHAAVQLAEIADLGPISLPLERVDETLIPNIRAAALALRENVD